MSYIDQQELFDKTNGGLDIILWIYPQAQQNVQDKRKKFKLRSNEKTASAAVKQLEDGNWVVTDFGGDQKPRNGVQAFMYEHNVDYVEAVNRIGAHFNVEGAAPKVWAKCTYEKKLATAEQQAAFEAEEKKYEFVCKEFTPEELELLGGPKFTAQMAGRQNLHSLQSYIYLKKDATGDLVQHIFSSTPEYPVFQFIFKSAEGIWGKRLEPKAQDKKDRFKYFGKRPKDYIMGLPLVKAQYEKLNDTDPEEYDKMNEADQKKARKETKLPEIILCSGDRDALSVMSLGYAVIWLNSETATLSHKQFNTISLMTYKVCAIPDIDSTGLRAGHELGMQHLDIHLIKLPMALLKKRDHRGNPCKDVRDFLAHHNAFEFRELIKLALPYRMWGETWKFNNATEKYYKEYAINLLQLYNFLEANGFYRFRLPNTKSGYIYIRVRDNVVEEIDHVEIKAFVNKFLEERKMEPEIRNTFFKARNHLAENSLSNLSLIEIDFTDYTRDGQYLFFKNKTWYVSKAGIQEFKPDEVQQKVWADEVIQHNVAAAEKPPFEVTWVEEEQEYSIKFNNKDCLFLKYLMNTSRIYWREQKELREKGEDLSDQLKQEQHQHLINKIYSLGYLMHRYKDPDRPWAVFAMDNKLSDDGESHGGSGKSIAYKAVRYFMKYVTLEGRNPRLTDNPHIWENVTNHTDYILIDDANQYLKFDFFYSALTGEMNVNPKHGKQYEIPFEEVPKMAITSNFGLRNTDPSTERRLLYTVFSDYYHFNKDGEYERSWSPADEFGKNLFLDFTEEEWNAFFNTMATCLQVYLNFGKIEPPMENVHKRNLVVAMTNPFKEWAEVYFSEDGGKVDTLICRKVAMEDYFLHNSRDKNKWTTNKFTKALKAFCKFHHFEYNPKVLHNDQGRIIRKHEGKAEEHIYIKAYSDTINDVHGVVKPFSPGSNDDDIPWS